jgi:hypothetical protein
MDSRQRIGELGGHAEKLSRALLRQGFTDEQQGRKDIPGEFVRGVGQPVDGLRRVTGDRGAVQE